MLRKQLFNAASPKRAAWWLYKTKRLGLFGVSRAVGQIRGKPFRIRSLADGKFSLRSLESFKCTALPTL